MTSHKDRLQAVNKKGFSLPRNYYGPSQNVHSNSHFTGYEGRSQPERLTFKDSEYQDPNSPQYLNMPSEQVTFDFNDNRRSQKSLERQPQNNSQPQLSTLKTNNTNKSYLNMHEPRTLLSNQQLYKSQSLNALKSKEPSKTLAKSSIQQEFHDKRVQRHIRGISHGKARKPCQIATAMFIMFGVMFIVGLTLICLTYVYKNINFSLDKGEMIGPVIMAGSFIFLGVGAKFIYDAHKIARKEQRQVAYQGYDRHYVGLKSGHNGIAREKLVSGTTTDIGLSRKPNKKQPQTADGRTLGRSSQKVYEKVDENSDI